ncbi:ankyrin repeat-containing domain protein [Astrocystis sublimbata]|nr:ankyrin repeat-containing domain protein [Astrocystis sublimbata]
MLRGRKPRHLQPFGIKPPCLFYSKEAMKEYDETPLEHDSNDEARSEALRQQPQPWSQADWHLWNKINTRNEERQDRRNVTLHRELESYFTTLNDLAPLPPALPKRSTSFSVPWIWSKFDTEERPFFAACDGGSMKVVRYWASEKRDALLQIGLQDGLAIAAGAGEVDVVRYLLDEGGAILDCSVIEAACRHRSLPLFEIAIRHGYHPNQQVPSNMGFFGVALNHCLDDHEITLFLLERGADPNLAPFQDSRRSVWGERATPPMDRTCGLALDLAIKGDSSLAVIRGLLHHGANPEYSRPFHSLMSRRLRCMKGSDGTQNEFNIGDEVNNIWQLLVHHGADVNAKTLYNGTVLICAIQWDMWDVVEFLLEHGADPKGLTSRGDAFQVAAGKAGIPWELADTDEAYLSHLTSLTLASDSILLQDSTPPQDALLQNPLVQALQRVKTKREKRA